MSIIRNLCVLEPAYSFADLQQTLTAMGWQPQADPTAPPPLIPDEPDMAVWVHPTTGDRLTYTFHPAMHLRVLMVEGTHAEQHLAKLAEHLPTLTAKDAEELMQSLEIESILLGIAIAEVLGAIELLDVIAALIEHPDQLIAQEASRVFQRFLSTTTTFSLELLTEWKAQHSEHSALFRMVGGFQERRQVLRWLMHDRPRSNPAIDATLRTALEDPDWEVRVTAILAAARLQAVAVRRFVHQVKLPNSNREGLDATDRRILVTLRQVALALLDGQSLPPQTDEPLTTRTSMRAHILRCIAGLPVTWCDRVFLLIHALTQPLPAEPQPTNLPAGIRVKGNDYYLAQTNLHLVWVPPISHWLGDERIQEASNSIRMITPATGFFVSQKLVTATILPQLENRSGNSPSTNYFLGSWEEANQQCLHLNQQEGMRIRLPSADEWEMAARGPDGRRFPWGNGLEKDWRNAVSPWGVQESVGMLEQWTNTKSASDRAIVCGKLTKFGCAGRTNSALNVSNIGFRILVELPK